MLDVPVPVRDVRTGVPDEAPVPEHGRGGAAAAATGPGLPRPPLPRAHPDHVGPDHGGELHVDPPGDPRFLGPALGLEVDVGRVGHEEDQMGVAQVHPPAPPVRRLGFLLRPDE